MAENRGSWYMLLVAFLFAASINYDKIAMFNSDPVFGMVFTLSSATRLRSWSFSERSAGPGQLRHADKVHTPTHFPETLFSFRSCYVPAFLTGIFASAECVAINIAYTLQIAPYVIAIKRLSIIIMVLYGTLL